MALTIRYQTAHQTLRVVDRVEDVPKDATIIWYDLKKKMNGLKHTLILMI